MILQFPFKPRKKRLHPVVRVENVQINIVAISPKTRYVPFWTGLKYALLELLCV